MGKKSHPLSARDPLAAEHGRTREEPLVARDFVLVVVEESEISFSQLEQRHVGGRAHVERAAVVEQREEARSIDGGSRDSLIKRHAVTEQLRTADGKVDEPGFVSVRV